MATATKKTHAAEMLDELVPMLTRLKLTAIRDQLDGLLDQAARAELNLREALAMLCAAEVARKDERRIQMGMSIAKFPCVRTLEGFEYDAQPSVDPKQVRELATSRWVANGDSLLLLGPPGVGKTHLAVALGREAIVRGYSTLFVPATALVTSLARAHAEGRLEDIPRQTPAEEMARIDALCSMFGIGLVTFDPRSLAAPDFKLVVRPLRHEPDLFYTNRYIRHVEKELFS